MDFNENNGERLFEARNENSVLFSLDSLNAIDKESENGDGGLNTNNEASGLINLNMLSQMSNDGESGNEGGLGEPVMGSMTFNQVVTRKNKRNLAIVIAAFVLLAIAGGVAGYMIYKSGQEEKEKLAQNSQQELDQVSQENAALASDKTKLEEKVAQLESDTATLNEKDAEIAELQRQIRELQLSGGAPSTERKPGGGGSGSSSKPNSGGGGSDSGAAPAPKAGPKADPNAIKAALAEANKKAAKCAKGGTLNISFTLSGSGKASNVSAVGGSFKGTPSERCILTVFEKHSYPTFSGASIPVKYTVKLQ